MTAVGDPFQAIYGWRGAAASNITSFADDFRRADGRVARRYALTVNRRSGRTILDVANVLSAPLRTALPEQGDTEGLGLLEPPPEAGPAQVRAATFATWPEEVSWIADQIVTAHRSGLAPAWADIAVLTRRNADIAPLYGELTDREVPVEIVGLGGLLHLPEVMDVTATLRLVDDVTANPDLIRLLAGPRWQIGPRDLALLGRRARELAQGRRPPGGSARHRRGARGGGGRRRPDRGGEPARRAGESGRRRVRARSPPALRAAGRRTRRVAPAQRRAGARPDPPGHRH